MVLRIGQQVGNYRITHILSRGTYAHVYQASHAVFQDRQVAIKLLYTTQIGDDKERFFHEARVLAQLRHPNILSLVDAGMYENSPYTVTEFAPKGSLRELLAHQRGQPLPFAEAITILRQVGQALNFAHQQHLLHCDIKPENILFNERSEALMADFDNARKFGLMPVLLKGKVGTPLYMAPEQFQGRVGKESDEYSLACVTYELLTGVPPFQGRDLNTLMQQHTTEQPKPPSQLNPQIPRATEEAILQALSKKPAQRHRDIAAFVDALNPGAWVNLIGKSRLLLTDHIRDAKDEDTIYYEPTVVEEDMPSSAEPAVKKRAAPKTVAKKPTTTRRTSTTTTAASTKTDDTPPTPKKPAKRAATQAKAEEKEKVKEATPKKPITRSKRTTQESPAKSTRSAAEPKKTAETAKKPRATRKPATVAAAVDSPAKPVRKKTASTRQAANKS